MHADPLENTFKISLFGFRVKKKSTLYHSLSEGAVVNPGLFAFHGSRTFPPKERLFWFTFNFNFEAATEYELARMDFEEKMERSQSSCDRRAKKTSPCAMLHYDLKQVSFFIVFFYFQIFNFSPIFHERHVFFFSSQMTRKFVIFSMKKQFFYKRNLLLM